MSFFSRLFRRPAAVTRDTSPIVPVSAKPTSGKTSGVTAKGLNLIEHFEGCKLTAYKDMVGVWTIGIGHTAMAGPPVPRAGMTITRAEAFDLLNRDLVKYADAVDRAVTVRMSDQERDALVSLCYNVGPGNFSGSTLVKKLNAGDRAGAADQFLVWNRAGGAVVAGLTRRRRAERHLFLTGALRYDFA